MNTDFRKNSFDLTTLMGRESVYTSLPRREE